MVREGIVKSAMYGLIGGLAAAIVVAFSTVFASFNGVGLSLGIFAGVMAALTACLYFFKFRPQEKSVIEKLDRLGFDERFITMHELKGDSSVIAELQRNNTISVLTQATIDGRLVPPSAGYAEGKLERLGLSVKTVSVSSALLAVAIIALVLTGLPQETKTSIFSPLPTFTLSYGVDAGGLIHDGGGKVLSDGNGKFTQTVTQGSAGSKIVANAFAHTDGNVDGDYVFVGWSDEAVNAYGKIDPSRIDKNIGYNMNITAKFELIERPEDMEFGEEGNGQGENGDPGKDVDDGPPSESNSNSPPQPGSPEDGANAGITENNGQIIDGNTDYREQYPEYYEQAMKLIAEGKELPPELRKFIETYMGSLK